jgi:hypothetical protein
MQEEQLVVLVGVAPVVGAGKGFFNTIENLQTQVQGLKWKVKQMQGKMAGTEKMLKENDTTIIRLKQIIAGKERAGAHKRKTDAAYASPMGLQSDGPAKTAPP